MKEMQKENPNPSVANNSMVMFVVINTASIQLIPTFMGALRAQYGAQFPFDILPAVWLCFRCIINCGSNCGKVTARTQKNTDYVRGVINMESFSVYIVPVVICIIIVFGLFKACSAIRYVYCRREGRFSIFHIYFAFLDRLDHGSYYAECFRSIRIIYQLDCTGCRFLGFPAQVLPLALLRPISGSGSTAVLTEIFQNYGADGFIGRVASVMMGSYRNHILRHCRILWFSGYQKTRHAIPAALMADTTGYIMSVLAVNLFFVNIPLFVIFIWYNFNELIR